MRNWKKRARLGAEIRVNEAVSGFSTDGVVQVTTDRGAYTADKIVITAGPWLPEMLSRERAQNLRRATAGPLLVQAEAQMPR